MSTFEDTSWRRVDILECAGPVAVIGDIHGRADLLATLLSRLDALHPQKAMPVVVVGDVIDRGPDSRGVLELLVARGARGVRGNHEEWFVCYTHGGGFDSFVLNPLIGGRATLQSYDIRDTSSAAVEAGWQKIPASHRAWVSALPAALRIVVDGHPFWVVHAGVSESAVTTEDPVQRMHVIARDAPQDLVWPSRDIREMGVLDAPVISGHVVRDDPKDEGHAIAIDTGCGTREDGALTAVVLPKRRFVTVRERHSSLS